MQRLTTGSIIEVFIKDINRYAYLKYINVNDFIEHVNFPFQFRVNENFYKAPLEDTGSLDFDHLLFSPLHLAGFKDLIKIGEWKIKGKHDIAFYDKQQHHYKMAWPPSLIILFNDIKEWRVLEEINNINQGKLVPYERCAHLEYVENLGADYLSFRLIIEYYKAKGEKIDIDNSGWSKFEKALFSRYTNMPVYKNVPDEFKGRLLPDNYSGSLFWLKKNTGIDENM